MRFRRHGDPWMRSSERNESDGPVSGIFAGKDRERKTAAVMTAVFVYLAARVSNGLKPRFSFYVL